MRQDEDELWEELKNRQEEERLIAQALICQQFKESPMYALMDGMLASLEGEAMNSLRSYQGKDRDEVFHLNLRWQERRNVRQALKDQIDFTIEGARGLEAQRGVDSRSMD